MVVNYKRYYFSNGLRWTLSVLLLLLTPYLIFIGWYVHVVIGLIVIFVLWSFLYIISIDLKKRVIKDLFYRFAIPFGDSVKFNELNNLRVTRENKKYKATTRSREYWVNYTEYTLHLIYDGHHSLVLFTRNDPDNFKNEVEKFAKKLNIEVLNA